MSSKIVQNIPAHGCRRGDSKSMRRVVPLQSVNPDGVVGASSSELQTKGIRLCNWTECYTPDGFLKFEFCHALSTPKLPHNSEPVSTACSHQPVRGRLRKASRRGLSGMEARPLVLAALIVAEIVSCNIDAPYRTGMTQIGSDPVSLPVSQLRAFVVRCGNDEIWSDIQLQRCTT